MQPTNEGVSGAEEGGLNILVLERALLEIRHPRAKSLHHHIKIGVGRYTRLCVGQQCVAVWWASTSNTYVLARKRHPVVWFYIMYAHF